MVQMIWEKLVKRQEIRSAWMTRVSPLSMTSRRRNARHDDIPALSLGLVIAGIYSYIAVLCFSL